MKRFEDQVLSEVLSMEEFEVLAADLTEAFRAVPNDLQIKKLQVRVS